MARSVSLRWGSARWQAARLTGARTSSGRGIYCAYSGMPRRGVCCAASLRHGGRGQHSRRRICAMLYMLLFPLHTHYPGFNVLRYETFRSVLAGLAALALSLALGPRADSAFSRGAYRADHPRRSSAKPSEKSRHAHDGRTADPRVTALIATVLLADPRNPYVWLAMSRDARLRRDRLHRRLSEAAPRHAARDSAGRRSCFGSSPAPSSPRWCCSWC